jgi:hypothetical protein
MAVHMELLRVNQENVTEPPDTTFNVAHVASAVLISLGLVGRR